MTLLTFKINTYSIHACTNKLRKPSSQQPFLNHLHTFSIVYDQSAEVETSLVEPCLISSATVETSFTAEQIPIEHSHPSDRQERWTVFGTGGGDEEKAEGLDVAKRGL